MQELYVVLAVTLLAVVSPGADFAMVSRNSYVYGRMAGVCTAMGIAVAIWLHVAYSVLGVGLLLRSTPLLMQVVQTVGALYLAYLGLQAWQSKGGEMQSHAEHVVPTPSKLFRMGMAVALSNPKAILFFAAFFPKFVDASLPQGPQYLVLTLSFFVIETIWQLIYTVSGKALAAWLQQGRRLQTLNRVCGAIFILIAISLLWDSAHTLLSGL